MRRSLGLDRIGRFAVLCVLVAAAAGLTATSGANADEPDQNLYLALGDSAAAGMGDTSGGGGFVGRLGAQYESTLGVTDTVNLAVSGSTSTTLIGSRLTPALELIAEVSDVRALTVTIGGNDTLQGCSMNFDKPSCPLRANLAHILGQLKAALADDPGDEVFTVMAYYNPAAGLGPQEDSYDIALLGQNQEAGICDADSLVGLNDVIFQEAGKLGLPVADPFATFKPQGQSLMSGDGLHLNAAGYEALVPLFLEPVAPTVCTGPPELPGPEGPPPGGPPPGPGPGGPGPGPVADADPPETRLTKVTRSRSRAPGSIRFTFRSSEAGSSFRCRLDGGRYRACRSPRAYRGLTRGAHVFRVRAIDAAGNADPTPAKRRFRVR